MIKEIHKIIAICDICGCEYDIKNRLDRDERLCGLMLPMRNGLGEYETRPIEVCKECAKEIALVLGSHYDMRIDEHGDMYTQVKRSDTV